MFGDCSGKKKKRRKGSAGMQQGNEGGSQGGIIWGCLPPTERKGIGVRAVAMSVSKEVKGLVEHGVWV